jgi:hypothetical protein
MGKKASYVNGLENGCVLAGENSPQARFFGASVHESARNVQNGAGAGILAGWEAAPVGRRCPDCGGAVKVKVVGVWERHGCRRCGWEQGYRTG